MGQWAAKVVSKFTRNPRRKVIKVGAAPVKGPDPVDAESLWPRGLNERRMVDLTGLPMEQVKAESPRWYREHATAEDAGNWVARLSGSVRRLSNLRRHFSVKRPGRVPDPRTAPSQPSAAFRSASCVAAPCSAGRGSPAAALELNRPGRCVTPTRDDHVMRARRQPNQPPESSGWRSWPVVAEVRDLPAGCDE